MNKIFNWLLNRTLKRHDGYQTVMQAILRHIKDTYTEQNEPTDIAYFFEQALAAAKSESTHCTVEDIALIAQNEIRFFEVQPKQAE